MGYYYQYDYAFSFHGLQRCKERLKIQDETEVKATVIRLIRESTHVFETQTDLYFKAGTTSLYFVVNKKQKLIITCTPVSVEKQMSLLDGDY